MKPVSPVITDQDLPEVVMGKGQEAHYDPLPSVHIHGPAGEVLTRWELSDDERAMLVAGGSVYLSLYTFGQPLQPVLMTVEPPKLTLQGGLGLTPVVLRLE